MRGFYYTKKKRKKKKTVEKRAKWSSNVLYN